MAKRRRLKKISLTEISLVGNPAQPGATALILKNAKPPKGEPIRKLADVLTTEEVGHQHGVEVSFYDNELHVWVQRAQAEGDDSSHSHAVAIVDGDFVLAVSGGHTHTIDRSALMGSILMGGRTIKTEEDDMSEKELQKQLDELKAQNERLSKVAGLPGDQKSHYDTLDEAGQTEFLAKSATERDTIVKANTDANAVVYTTRDGDLIRKSDGPALLAMAKRLDAQAERNETLEKAREDEKLEKRAREELPHLTAKLSVRAAALKAFDGIEDEETRKGCHQILTAANGAQAYLFKAQGVSGSPEPGTADDDLEKMVKDYMVKHTVKRPQATEALAQTEAYKLAYARKVRGAAATPTVQ